jgi:hypothetical protein
LRENTQNSELKTLLSHHEKSFILGQTNVNFDEQLKSLAVRVFDVSETPKPVSSTSTNPKTYNLSAINKLLMSFDDENLKTLCMFNFEKVYENFAAGQSKQERAMKLISYCKEFVEMDKLLEATKEQNEVAFDKFKPYF